MLVKNTVTTVTRYPIRRVDLTIGVAYTEAIDQVMRVLREVADAHPAVLDEPETVIVFNGFGESSLNFMIGAWTIKEDVLKVKNELPLRIKEAFDREGIEIPFPHRVLASGKAMEPRIEATVRDLQTRIGPRVVAPGHCTGWRAKAALVQAFAPGRYGPSSVGSMYVLTAPS